MDSHKNYNPLSATLITLATFFGSQILAAVMVAFVPFLLGLRGSAVDQWYLNNPFSQFLLIGITGLLNYLIIRWVLRKYDIPVRNIGLNKPQATHLGLAFLGVGVYFFAYLLVIGLVSALVPGLNLEQEQELGFNKSQQGIGLILVFISLVIVPPLVEEFVMRGFLFTGLRTKLTFYWATLITSGLFAIAHLPAGVGGLLWIGAVDTFVLSLVLCYLREQYKSLWPPIGVHMLKNGLAFTVVFLLGDKIL